MMINGGFGYGVMRCFGRGGLNELCDWNGLKGVYAEGSRPVWLWGDGSGVMKKAWSILRDSLIS